MQTVPSEFLQAALEDLKLCEADPAYHIKMSQWHNPGSAKEPCAVCLAGAHMAQKLGVGPDRSVCPTEMFNCGEISYRTRQHLFALDDIRDGYIGTFLERFELDTTIPDNLSGKLDVTEYRDGPKAWHSEMKGIVTLLQEHDL